MKFDADCLIEAGSCSPWSSYFLIAMETQDVYLASNS